MGGAASQRLWQLSAQYPDRMYCPVDHYVAGQEKELLLQATDFCLLPSRFEPCGLVDVEFGWVSVPAQHKWQSLRGRWAQCIATHMLVICSTYGAQYLWAHLHLTFVL